MTAQRLPWVLSLVLAFGCAQRPTPLPLPQTFAQPISVLTPNNRTVDPLVVASDSVWEDYSARSRHEEVADLLAAEIRLQLKQRGFPVASEEATEAAVGTKPPNSPAEAVEMAAAGKLMGNVLYVEILRWEPDMPIRPRRLLVALQANLIDPTTGQVVWTVHHPLQPVPTPGAINEWIADMIAAHIVAEELISPWGTVHPPPNG